MADLKQDSIFEFGETVGYNSPFGNWLKPSSGANTQGVKVDIHVTQVTGPSIVSGGAIYEYRITGFNTKDFVLSELVSKVKWGYSIDEKSITTIYQRSVSVPGKNEILLKWKVPRSINGSHLKVSAWLNDQDVPAATSAAIRMYPFLFNKYREKELDESATVLADDLRYGDGVHEETGHFAYTIAEIESISSSMHSFIQNPIKNLRLFMRVMVSTLFSVGELEAVALSMVDRFEQSTGALFSDTVLTKNIKKHQSTVQFITNIENGIKQKLKDSKGDPKILFDGKTHLNSQLYDRPHFGTSADKFAGGLTICWNDTWAYEVKIESYDMINAFDYIVRYSIALYDHFGLNIEDLTDHPERIALGGFKAWIVLQHIHNVRPFIATAAWENSITGRL